MSRHRWLDSVIAAIAVLASLAFGVVANAADFDPNAPDQSERNNPVNYDVDFSVVVTAPYHTELLRVWLPLPPTTAAQQVSDRRIGTFPMIVEPKIAREDLYGNEFAYFEFKKPEGAQIIRHQFKAKVFEQRWQLDPGKVTRVEKWPASFDKYMQPQADVAGNPEFQQMLKTLSPEPKGTQDLFAVMQWVDREMKYDHVDASLRADANHAFTKRQGHCSDYHGLCATMGRALGCPTRMSYGINLFPKNSPSHCKLEAFLPPYGWVSFDVSETQRMVAAIKKDDKISAADREKLAKAAADRNTSGFRDNTWLLVTRGRDYNLVPPASKPVNVVRTIYAEADGVPLKDPDPANEKQREFGWMTIHDYKADKKVSYPYKDVKTLTP